MEQTIEDAILVDDEKQSEEEFKAQQMQRYEEYIAMLLDKGGFKNRRTAEKWALKEHNKKLAKFHKQVKLNAGKEKPLFTVTDEELAEPI